MVVAQPEVQPEPVVAQPVAEPVVDKIQLINDLVELGFSLPEAVAKVKAM